MYILPSLFSPGSECAVFKKAGLSNLFELREPRRILYVLRTAHKQDRERISCLSVEFKRRIYTKWHNIHLFVTVLVQLFISQHQKLPPSPMLHLPHTFYLYSSLQFFSLTPPSPSHCLALSPLSVQRSLCMFPPHTHCAVFPGQILDVKSVFKQRYF